ncbi:MAG: hydrolase [Tissierellia bacterium]|nr:hydrolase [Tissierellia bacterium]
MSFSKKSNFPDKNKDFRIIPEKYIPEIESELRKKAITIPKEVYDCSGIRIQGTRIKSFLFSMDIAVIKNSNAQSILAVYPFTPQLSIIDAIIKASSVPVFAGVGGGITSGQRSIQIAIQSELMGAYGVVVNSPMPAEIIAQMYEVLDIPIVATVTTEYDDIVGKINAGARILNISGGKETASLIKKVRAIVGDEFPIIATGGHKGENITRTIQAGANGISYTPPSSAELFQGVMEDYRQNAQKKTNPNDPKKLIPDYQDDLVFSPEEIEYIEKGASGEDDE